MKRLLTPAVAFALLACSQAPEGIAPAAAAQTTVRFDFDHRPLPEIPLPNDIATRADPTSATGLRLNVSMLAPTRLEERVRRKIDALDGWGLFQPITIPFTRPLSVQSILDAHRDVHYDLEDDVVYLINIDEDSEDFGKIHYLDLGNGNYPVILERRSNYWPNDPRDDTIALAFEEVDEDLNGNGVLDPGEDTDADGHLDRPNYLPGATPAIADLAGRADAMMSFYERETNTLIVRPMKPLDERTTYAVVITRRLLDADDEPVGSPYPFIHHLAQTEALRPLPQILPAGTSLDEVAFAFTFTTQSVRSYWRAVREGLYGHGVQKHLGEDYPPVLDRLFELRDWDAFPEMERAFLISGEDWINTFASLSQALLGANPSTEEYRRLMEGLEYVDFIVIGSFTSPQLFPRTDDEGNFLNLDDQSWPEDLDSVVAEVRPEQIYFTLIVPRKEISVRGDGEPAPVLVMGHGYGSNRFEALQWAGYWARHGLATISIDGPSHGLGISDGEKSLAVSLLANTGARSLGDAIFLDRAFDQNGDTVKDSAADFWTSYLFHTRDVVRQFALDYMQLIRIVRTWDGEETWSIDTVGDGRPDLNGLAGDFDGDGVVDIGASSMMVMAGGSLGGIMSMVTGAVEPELTAIAPMAGGGGYSDMGLRTTQGGAIEGFMMRSMGPFYLGTIEPVTGDMVVTTLVLDLTDAVSIPIGRIPATVGLGPGDTMVVENMTTGERACGLVQPDGEVRAALASDIGDILRIRFYIGPQNLPGTQCEVAEGLTVAVELTAFEQNTVFQTTAIAAGSPLRSMTEGLGLPRAHPDLRRFVSIGQLVLDPADPAVLARHLLDDPLEYPALGQQTGTHALVISTQGDTSVPVSTGLAFARALGVVRFLEDDPAQGVPANQALIDAYVAEGVDVIGRAFDENGRGVHRSVDDLSEGTHPWGANYPTISNPLRAGADGPDPLGGISAALFPVTNPTGQHGFPLPGAMVDDARAACAAACPGTLQSCGCDTLGAYDVGTYLLNLAGSYLASGGKTLNFDLCQSDYTCPGLPPPPPARPPSERP